jgi:GDP/UDP-N,N'-diacetylbacillosamine 2-epimerase (hydrolysing)
MKIAILTSSRADFSIYLPLIEKINKDKFFNLNIIAFGSHLSEIYGYTIDNITQRGIKVKYKLTTTLINKNPSEISISIGDTINTFAKFWKNHNDFDLVFCLGDRFEMFAAVYSGLSFQIKFAHIHGGETTLGAIDNVFRHSITLASKYHFTSTLKAKQKVEKLIGQTSNVFHVGSLGIECLSSTKILSVSGFKKKWGIDLSKKTILTTFHPETVAIEMNTKYVKVLIESINKLNKFQFLITMPNADTEGGKVRTLLINEFANSDRVFLVENLGVENYFSAMYHCSFLLGNTSSGIIEAASFQKWVINLGDRQKGREYGPNVINIPIKTSHIIKAVNNIKTYKPLTNKNIYSSGLLASDEIINQLKNIFKSNYN